MSQRPGMPRRSHPWLELLRISLAPTVVADVCAGVALARGGPAGADGLLVVARLAPVSLLLFCGGMALNGWVDREEDRNSRPRRPLPSGSIRPAAALAFALCALVLAPVLAWFAGGEHGRDAAAWSAGMAAAIALYHTPLKRTLLGPFVLGAVRGGDLLLGAVGLIGIERGIDAAWPAAAAYAVYVLGASFVAHEEDRSPRMAIVRAGVVIAFAGVLVNAGLAWARAEGRGDSQSAMIAGIVGLWHVVGSRGTLLLFKQGAPGLTPLSSFARILLARLPLLPIAAAFGASAGDLGMIGVIAFVAVLLLVRVVPPT